jgi:hypothetical protein
LGRLCISGIALNRQGFSCIFWAGRCPSQRGDSGSRKKLLSRSVRFPVRLLHLFVVCALSVSPTSADLARLAIALCASSFLTSLLWRTLYFFPCYPKGVFLNTSLFQKTPSFKNHDFSKLPNSTFLDKVNSDSKPKMT